jgi:hypothetical protein
MEQKSPLGGVQRGEGGEGVKGEGGSGGGQAPASFLFRGMVGRDRAG